jgi:hypothetical protein
MVKLPLSLLASSALNNTLASLDAKYAIELLYGLLFQCKSSMWMSETGTDTHPELQPANSWNFFWYCSQENVSSLMKQIRNKNKRNKKTIHITYIHKQLYRHIMVTGFDYLLTIIRPKTCGSITTEQHTNTLLLIKVKLIPMVVKAWKTISSLTWRLYISKLWR